MLPISAADAISPAIQRTKILLFSPFEWGTFLKLGLVALITEGLGSRLNTSHGGGQPSSQGPMIYHFTPGWIAVIVAAILAFIVVGFVIAYLVTRLRFAFFHCLIHNTKEIRPGWRFYRPQATRFFWLNVVVGLCFLLVVALIALPFAGGFLRLFHDTPPGGRPDVGVLLSLVLPLIPIILVLVLAAVVADFVLRDLMLPHYALDDADAGEAWAEVWSHIMMEKGQFIAYGLLRLVLPILAQIALFIILIIPGLIVAGVFAAFEVGIHSAFANATGAAAMVGIMVQVFFGVLAFGFALLVSICLGGPLSTWIREYALLFYGGRYQRLGDILYPPPPPPDTRLNAPGIA